MITRIVKMTFKTEGVQKFEEIFEKSADLIRSFDGCKEVKLMRDINNANAYFTLSSWQSEEHLNVYRSSLLFQTAWAEVKLLFSEKAQAWSLMDTNP